MSPLSLTGWSHLPSGRGLIAACAKAKVYGLRCEDDDKDLVKTKGSSTKPRLEDLVRCIQEPNQTVYTTYHEIAKKNFILTTRQSLKLALNSLNDKW